MRALRGTFLNEERINEGFTKDEIRQKWLESEEIREKRSFVCSHVGMEIRRSIEGLITVETDVGLHLTRECCPLREWTREHGKGGECTLFVSHTLSPCTYRSVSESVTG